jgi:hypothetical protein
LDDALEAQTNEHSTPTGISDKVAGSHFQQFRTTGKVGDGIRGSVAGADLDEGACGQKRGHEAKRVARVHCDFKAIVGVVVVIQAVLERDNVTRANTLTRLASARGTSLGQRNGTTGIWVGARERRAPTRVGGRRNREKVSLGRVDEEIDRESDSGS